MWPEQEIRKKEETKTKTSAHEVRFKSKIREGGPDGTKKIMEERICETDEFLVWE